MSDRDVDAEFADIIAHWDDVEALPDPAPQDASRQHEEAANGAAEAPDGSPPADTVHDSKGDRPGGQVNPSPLADRTNPVNPPPLLGSVPVWRGATGGQPGSVEPGVAAEAGDTDDSDDEDHFEPGPTAPLPPQEDVQFWGIIVGLVAGPLILLWLVLFRPNVSDWWLLIALGLTIGGFGLLVMRQPHSRDEDDPDNGARV